MFTYNCALALGLTEEEKAWLSRALKIVPYLEERWPDDYPMIDTSIQGDTWWANGEGGDFARIGYFISRAFLKKFRPDGVIVFQWIDDDKHGYYGGAVAVSLNNESWINLDTWVDARREGLPASREEKGILKLRDRLKQAANEQDELPNPISRGVATGLRQALVFMHEEKLI